MPSSDHAVIIAGGGPTGLMLAGELALAGVDAAIVERRADVGLTGQRAGGLHARTLEIFDQRGIADRFLAEGQKAQQTGFAGVMFDLRAMPTRHPYTLGIWQVHIERILRGWVEELGVPTYRGVDVTSFTQDESNVDVTLGDGRSLRATWLVGCDGGRSLIRKAAGIEFPGSEATTSNITGEVETKVEPPLGMHRTTIGIHGFSRGDYTIVDGKIVYATTGPVRVMITEKEVGATGEPTMEQLRAGLIDAFGTDYGIHSPLWLSRFTDAARQAASYRKGRVLIAGDAAHIHPPDGGHGLQAGVQDAVNLGWKLAQVVRGISPESLLDTYQSERHPVTARMIRHTMASVAFRRDDDRTKAARETMAELLAMDGPKRYFAAESSELAIRYDFGQGHPLLGRRMPDLDLASGGRVYELLRDGRPLLLNLGRPGSIDVTPWRVRVRLIDASYEGAWELPDAGVVSPPSAVLVRPDGHVAWVGEGSDAGLTDVLRNWFGQPA
jgi:2-polyprenyl-6-methoxyphenol hydroxylase-like FAD-dependent oxidoreductase